MAKQNTKPTPRRVEIVRGTYRPSKAELEEDLRVAVTFDEAVDALARPVKTRRTASPKKANNRA